MVGIRMEVTEQNMWSKIRFKFEEGGNISLWVSGLAGIMNCEPEALNCCLCYVG